MAVEQGQQAPDFDLALTKEERVTLAQFRGAHLALDYRVHARLQGADRSHAGAVLVAQRQVEQQILHGENIERREFFRQPRPDTAQLRDRDLIEGVGDGGVVGGGGGEGLSGEAPTRFAG